MKTTKLSKRKSFLAVLLSACLLIELLPMTAIAAFANNDDPYSYKFSQDAVITAVQEAVDQERVVTDKLDFQGESAETYDELFTPDGSLYELDLDTMGLKDSAQRDSVLSLRVFARVSGNGSGEDGYQADGSEKILFLLANSSPEVVTAKIYMDDLESHRITVLPAEETVSDASVVTESEAAAETPEEQPVEVLVSGDAAEPVEPEAAEEIEVIDEIDAADETEEAAEIEEIDETGEAVPEEEPAAVIDLQEDAEADAESVDEQTVTVSEEVSEQAEAVPVAETEEIVVEETTDAESAQADLPEESEIDPDKLLDGTIYDAVYLGTDGAAAFETALTVDGGISTLAAGETHTITYKEMDSYGVLEFPDTNPTGVTDGSTLEFSVIIPDGYGFESVTANGTPLAAFDSVDIDGGERYQHFYRFENVTEDVAIEVTAYKGQIIDGYGRITVTDRSQSDAVYTVTIQDVPTNTPISLSYTEIEITNAETGEVLHGVTLTGRLYYVPDGYMDDTDEWQLVSYFQLDGSKIVSSVIDGDKTITYYEVVPYGIDEEGEAVPFDMNAGALYIKNTSLVPAKAEIMPIQTDTLCSLEGEDEVYTETLIDATEMTKNPQIYYYPGYEDEVISLSALTNGLVEVFYYGDLSKGVDGLTECTEAKIMFSGTNDQGEPEYALYPIGPDGEAVTDFGNLYMEYDQLYSFDVVVNSIVNEHSEDDGHVYLWTGGENGEYYVDKYHNQGAGTGNYTNADASDDDPDERGSGKEKGVWVQLATLRTDLINSGSKAFSDYENVFKDELIDEGVTETIANAVSANYNYGIAGPYYMDPEETEITQVTKRVTGHIGDEFTAMDAFDSEYVYMVTDDSTYDEETNPTGQYHEEWTNMGLTGPGYGQRGWWYWINDYYKLSDYEDLLEYVEIVRRNIPDEGVQIHLEADEMGTDGKGKDYDVWYIDLYTKRDNVIKEYMLENPEKFTEDEVGFSVHAFEPNHFQLRMEGTVETVIDNEVYFGELTAVTDQTTNDDGETEFGEYAPKLDYTLLDVHSDHGGEEYDVSNSVYIEMLNENEATSITFKDDDNNTVYVALDNRFDTDKVQFTVTVYFEGTLTCATDEEKTIEYGADTENGYFKYEATLTEDQLREAFDTCPNSSGYDFAVNLSAAVQQTIDTTAATILYKVWNDDSNSNKTRGDVDSVVVTLQRSKDGNDWEDVIDEDTGEAKEFTITPPDDEETGEPDLNANQWSLVLTEDDLDLTYGEGDDKSYYEIRIASEDFGPGEETTEGFTYNTIIAGTTVTNTLVLDTIDITGEKLWIDSDGEPLSVIPVDSVNITLYQDGNYFGRRTVTADDNWSFAFEDLPVWDGSVKYVYTLGEMTEYGEQVQEGDTFLIGNDWFHIEITENDDGTYTFKNITNPKKDVDVDGDETFGDSGVNVQVGDTLTYKIDYLNTSGYEATVTITDTLDEGLDFVSATDNGTYDEASRMITWTLDVPADTGGSVYFTATVNETALVKNEVANTASVQVGEEPAVDTNWVYNPIPDKNVDANEDDVFEDSGMQVNVGDTLVYKIDYENPDDTAATVTITDEVDVGLDFVSATDNGTYNESDRTITWVIDDVAAHTNGSVYFTATVNEDALVANVVINTATVQVGEHDGQQTKTVYNPIPGKDVDADGDGTYGDTGVGVNVGDELTYQITYTNGYDTSATVIITDELDEGLDYVSSNGGGVYDGATHTVTWRITTSAHTTGSVTVTVRVNETALEVNEVKNTATVQIGENSAVTNWVYNPVPDKDVDANGDDVFEDSGMQVQVGDTLVYKIDYENPDDTPATVTITDEVDVGLDFVVATDNGTYNENDRMITWVIEDVAAHNNGSVYFTATVNENALDLNVVENTATVQVGEHEAQQTKTVYNPIPTKDVDVDGDGKYGDSGDSVHVGDTLTYEITYTNDYSTPATVVITDVLDEGLDFVEASDGGTYDAATRTITWTFEGVEAFTSGSVTFTATVNETALVRSEVDNTATVQVGEDSADTNWVYNPLPDKDVDADGDGVYEDNGMQVQVGDTLVYKIDYQNPDDTAATVTITDEVDVGLDFVSATDNGAYDEDTRTITWVIEDVEPQSNGSVYFTTIVNETALVKNEVENTALVKVGDHDAQWTNTVYNPIPEKDVDADGDGNYGDSGLGTHVGDTLTYEITYKNDYDTPATVTITDELDVGLTFVSASGGGTYDKDTRTITWVIENVDPFTEGSVTFTATVNQDALILDVVENTASVQIGDDPAVKTNTVYNPLPEPDKNVDANGDEVYDDSGMQVQVGGTLVYKIDYENPDNTPATVTITDVLDEGLDFVEATSGGTYDETTRTVTWIIEGVEPHTFDSVYLTATVNETALVRNEVENTATVQVGEHDAQQTKTVYNPIPDKNIDVDGDGTYGDSGVGVKVGDTVTYEINYMNRYNTPATVTITDVLDEGLDFVEATSGGTYDEATRTVTWVIEDVDAHTGGSVTFTATVNDTALVRNEIDNTASVQVGDHPAVDTNTVYNPVPDKNVDANGDEVYDDSGMQVQVGGTLVYKIDYENPDDEAATVIITDEVDVGLDFVSATDNGSYDSASRMITWVIEGVEPHTSGSVYFTAIVNDTALVKNEVDNTATVQVGEHDAQQTKTVYNPIPGKDVDVDNDGTYGDNGESVQVGDTLTYEITYRNDYDVMATVTITDKLDDGLDYMSSDGGGVYDPATHTITWSIGVSGHTTGSVHFTATVNENALVWNAVHNSAIVQVGDDPDNTVDTNLVDNPVPDKNVDANGDEVYDDSGMQVQVGGTLVYKIDYENPDDTPATVTITDVLDEGLDFVSATDNGTYDSATRTITWVIEGVDDHTNGSVYFTATVNENALEKNEVENTATVQVGNHAEQQTKTVYNPIPSKDVDANGDGTYGDNGESVQVGDSVTYEITYKNGYDTAATVTITDVLDEGLTFVSATTGGTYDAATRTITWVITNVAPLGSGSVEFTATVNENALVWNAVTNSAIVQVGDDPDNTVDTNPVDNPVPDKDVDANGDGEYKDSGLQVQVGDELVYKIDYENPDDTPATVTITDEVDVGLDFVEATDNGSYDSASRMITWVIEGVEPHTNGSVYFTAIVNENALEKNEVENTATVQVGNHEAQQTKTVYNPIPEKDVYVNGDTHDDSGDSVHVGDTMTYEITYRNSYDTAADVTITDVLDEGLTFVSASDGGVYDEATRTITWTVRDVDAHTTGSVTFTATVNDSALDKNEIDNTASVQVGDDPNNTTWTNPVENPVPDKNVDANGDGEFDDNGMQVQVGGTLVYKIDYENPDATAATVTITDELDEGLDFVEATDNGSYDESSRVITWVIEDVEAHASGSVYFTAVVNETALVKNEVENTATVQIGEHDAQQTKTVYNPIPEKNVDADSDETYDDNGVSVQVGDTMAYEITYRNSYDTAATVTITDVLDEGLTFVSASDGGVYDEETRTITWIIGDVDAFTTGSVTFTATVNENALVWNAVHNSAMVQIGDDPDNTVDTNTVDNPVPDKDVDVNGDGEYKDSGMQVQVGDELIYKIDYENPDDTPATVTITDVLDEGLDFVSATDNGTYDSATRTITWVIEGVDDHTNGSVTFTATVNETALEKNEVENTATVQVGDHPEQQTKTVYNPIPEKAVDANGDDVFEDDGVKVNVGDDITYEITYKNSYDEAATVTITDVLDEGLTFVSATDNGTYDSATRTITWVISDVDAHTAGSVSFTATVNESAMTKAVVENIASVQIGDDPAVDTNKVENPLEPDEPTEPEKSVDVGDGTEVSVGEDLVYTITYYNNYNESVVVTVTDVLDEGLDFVSATDGGTYNESTRTVTWTLENVPAFTHGDVSFTATVNENAKTNMEVDNGASVQIGDDPAMDTNIVQNPLTPDGGTPDGGNPDGGNPDSGNPDSGTPSSGTPTSSGNPSSSTPTSSSNPSSGTTSNTLPQTGQLNWPIWLMAGLGIIVVALGIVMMQAGKKGKKKA